MEIDLEDLIGRKEKPVVAVVRRQLVEEELEKLQVERGVKPIPLKQLSQRHHALARELAAGTKPGAAAVKVGYTPSRVSILLADPAFQHLVAHYAEVVEETYADFHERLALLALEAAAELHNRLEENPESITSSMLLETIKAAADRTGFGPQSSTNVNVNVGIAGRLEAARKRASAITLVEAAE